MKFLGKAVSLLPVISLHYIPISDIVGFLLLVTSLLSLKTSMEDLGKDDSQMGLIELQNGKDLLIIYSKGR